MGINYIYRKSVLMLILFNTFWLFQSCEIKEPTAPNWDVSLNIPIAKKDYTLFDIFEKKSSVIKHYTDGSNKNLLYYTDIQEIDKFSLEGKLEIESFSKSVSETIGPITIGTDSVKSDIDFSWIGPGITPGTQTQVPPVNDAQVSRDFSIADQFQAIKIESGFIDIKITNYFPSPVSITIRDFILKNAGTGEIIAQYSTPIVIPPLQTAAVQSIPITAGVTVRNQLSMDCKISTNGSGGQIITMPSKSLIIYTKLRDLKVTEATAKIPPQDPVVIDGTVTIDETSSQPNKFQSIKLDEGLLNLTISNNLDIDAVATFTINNLKTPLGATFSKTQAIPRKQTVKILNNFSVKDYSIVSLTGLPTNQVSYQVTFQLQTTTDYRVLKSSDAVTGTIDFNSLVVKEFSGQLKPIVLASTRSSISFDVKDIQDKFQFPQINLKNPVIEFHLRPTANIEFSIEGKIEAKNSLGQKSTLTLSSRTLDKVLISPTDTVVSLNPDSVSNFFKKFTRLPDSIVVVAGGTVNPNYKIISVKKTDQVSGRSKIEIPLEFGISNCELSDSVKVEMSSDDRDAMRDFNMLEAALKITNGIAVSISFSGKLYDHNNNFLMYFPPKHADQDSVVNVNGGTTDENGNVISSTVQTVRIRLTKAEIDKLSYAKFMQVRLKFGTSRPGNLPVKFKTNDIFKIHASGSTNYHINP